MRPEYDVAVVGLGPVGATLTALLGQRGLRVLAIEQSKDVYALPRAAHIDHMGLRAVQELGLLDDLLPGMIPNPGLDFRSAAGETLMRVPGDQGSVSGLPASMYFHQPTLDNALRAKAVGQPDVDARIPVSLRSFEQHDDRVVLRLQDAEGASTTATASWLIGADGASSVVREQAGLALDDLGFDERWLVVDLQLPRQMPHLPDRAVHVCDPRRPHTAIPMPALRYRFELQLADDEDSLRVQEPEEVARLLSGWLDVVDVQVVRAATYTFHGLVASRWRAGRALIAGDAAHQMPPFLGQGMCSGLRDAVNLAWKLAWVQDRGLGTAKAFMLLDTYEAERRPHVRTITEAVIAFGDVICSRDDGYAAARDARLAADPRPLDRRIPFSLPRMVAGPLVLDGGGRLFGQPDVSRSDVPLDDLLGPRFAVIARDDAAVGNPSWWREQLDATVLVPCGDGPLDVFLSAALDRTKARLMVLRPDRYILYAGDDPEVPRRSISTLLDLDEDVRVA